MTEKEMIIKILEKENKPLMAKQISKLIYDNFNGFKLYRSKVRDHLWDEEGLKDLITYNKEDYTYSLQKNIESLKNNVLDDDFVFNIEIKKISNPRTENDLLSYKVIGDKVIISHSISEKDLDGLIIGLIRSEIDQSLGSKVNFKKLRSTIIKSINDRR
jgi:repressor of nif and glnA expression